MKSNKRYIVLTILGLFVFGSFSSALAEDRFDIDNQSIAAIVEHNSKGMASISSDGYIEIAWKVKMRNDTDTPVSSDVTVAFLNSNNDKLAVATKTAKIEPGESQLVSNTVLLRSVLAQKITSGYVEIAKAENDTENHSLSAMIDNSVKAGLSESSDKYVRIAYKVKLRNETNQPTTRGT